MCDIAYISFTCQLQEGGTASSSISTVYQRIAEIADSAYLLYESLITGVNAHMSVQSL